MNMAHFHLLSVHLPIVAIPLLALLLMAGMRLGKPDLGRAALWGMIVVGLLSIPIFFSGEGAEEVVEHLPSVSEHRIETHEKVATISLVMVLLNGLLAILSLVTTRFKLSCVRRLMFLTVVASLVASGALAWAANEGGKIRHTEIVSVKTGDGSEP